jgi:Domain of unknown function (DUF5666)
MTMKVFKLLVASAVAVLLAGIAQPRDVARAQSMQQAAPAAPPTVRVRATITSIDGSMLTLKGRDGVEMKLKLADNAPVNEIVKSSPAEIKAGAYVAVTGMPQPDGSQKAIAVYIFPEAQRGLAEGHRPWDFAPNSTMTNATIDSQVAGTDGQTLIVKYKDGEQKVLLTPATEITVASRKSAADLKPGQKVTVFAAKKLPDGTLEAPNLAFGDYGVWR